MKTKLLGALTMCLALSVLAAETRPFDSAEVVVAVERPAAVEASESVAAVEASESLDRLAFLAGEWTAEFETFAETWGDEGAGKMPGVVRGGFGPLQRWFDMEAEMELPSGPYAVKVLVYQDGRTGKLHAYVVNTFNSGATYTGRFDVDGHAVFDTRIGNTIQRVRYERHGERVRYVAEESEDEGATFRPHTEAWWTRVERG